MGEETYFCGPGSDQGGWRVLCQVRCPLGLNRAGKRVGAGTALREELCRVFFLESSHCRTFRLVPRLICSDRMHIKFQYKIYSYIYIKKGTSCNIKTPFPKGCGLIVYPHEQCLGNGHRGGAATATRVRLEPGCLHPAPGLIAGLPVVCTTRTKSGNKADRF